MGVDDYDLVLINVETLPSRNNPSCVQWLGSSPFFPSHPSHLSSLGSRIPPLFLSGRSERYRDLLSSSAALSTLFVSSSKLSSGLKEMKALSESAGDVDGGGSRTGGSVMGSEAGEDSIAEGETFLPRTCQAAAYAPVFVFLRIAELAAMLPVASQTKLLLDAPETLWRFLEHKQFLQAAWLFCLGRVVHMEAGEITDGPVRPPPFFVPHMPHIE
jgi:hypothetical protein